MSPRLRRLVAISILLLVIALVYHLGVRPIVAAHRQYDEQLTELSDLLTEFRRATANLTELRETLDTLQRQPALRTSYLSGGSEALVAAQLQNMVKQTIERAGGVLESTQIMAAEAGGPVRRIAVKIRMSGSIDSLFVALYELESKEPYLFVDQLDISAAPARRRPSKGAAKNSVQTRLRASFEVFGYMRNVQGAAP